MPVGRARTVSPRVAIVAAETALVALAILNGLCVRIIEALRDGVAGSLVPGVGPFELIAILVGLSFLVSTEHVYERAIGWREALTGGLLLVPSSSVAWFAVAAYAGVIASENRGDRRLGALIVVGLALTALWSSVVLRLVAAPVTAFEASLVANLLGVFVDGFVRTGNVIGQPAGHHLVLLTACTSADALPRALLAVAVVAIFAGARCARSVAVAAALAAVVFVLANSTRLAVMSASSELYELAHGPYGASLFDLLQVGLVVSAGYWASRR